MQKYRKLTGGFLTTETLEVIALVFSSCSCAIDYFMNVFLAVVCVDFVLSFVSCTGGHQTNADEYELPAKSKYYYTHDSGPGKLILILYGTEYGFSEEIAIKLFDQFAMGTKYSELALHPRALNMRDFAILDFKREQLILYIVSTSGDGTNM